eukprot:jgi/Astpho2/7512/gw1.00114.27.1_t
MECGHFFCNDCWRGHFRVQISEGNSRRIKCMQDKCNTICDEEKVGFVLAIWRPADLHDKYCQRLLESYIDDNKRVKWCPSTPHCGRALTPTMRCLQVDGEQYCEPECPCGLKFCFACNARAHSPCTCDMWRQWQTKCNDDSETQHWLSANTKPCPKCSNQVEKNGGCNLVVCRCGQSFCWLCGSATGRAHTWETISGHSCGRYRDDADKRIDEAQRNLKRFMHYCGRWEAHEASHLLEEKLQAATQARIARLEDTELELKDWSWLLAALEQLFHARRILGFSYVAAFFMFGGSYFKNEVTPEQNELNQNLFEDQQQQLEAEVERLSKLIETDVDEVKEDIRVVVINCSSTVDARLLRLYEQIEIILNQITGSPQYIAPYKA